MSFIIFTLQNSLVKNFMRKKSLFFFLPLVTFMRKISIQIFQQKTKKLTEMTKNIPRVSSHIDSRDFSINNKISINPFKNDKIRLEKNFIILPGKLSQQ